MKYQTCFLLVVICISSFAFGDMYWYDGNIDNHNWSNVGNWGSVGHVPGASDGTIYVKPGLSATYGKPAPGSDPIIQSTVPDIYRLFIGDKAGGEGKVTFENNGSLTVTDRVRLGGYQASPFTPKSHGILEMNGGSLTILGAAGLEVGQKNTDGTIYMNAGTITTPLLKVPGSTDLNCTGTVYLDGGLIDVGSGGLSWSQSWNEHRGVIDITEGTLRVQGTIAATDFSRGWIIAYGDTGELIVDTETEPGYTIVTAVVPEPISIALLALGGILTRRFNA